MKEDVELTTKEEVAVAATLGSLVVWVVLCAMIFLFLAIAGFAGALKLMLWALSLL